MLTTTQTNSESNSLEVSMNAKGDYSYTVKIYAEDLTVANTKLLQVDKWFKHTFGKQESNGHHNGNGGGVNANAVSV